MPRRPYIFSNDLLGSSKIRKAGFVVVYPQGVEPGTDKTPDIQPAGQKPATVAEITGLCYTLRHKAHCICNKHKRPQLLHREQSSQ